MTEENQPKHHQINFNEEEREFLDKKFQTTNRKDRIQKIKEFILQNEQEELSLKDQKLKQEILKLKLQNQLTLKIELNKPLNEIKKIVQNPHLFEVKEPEESHHTEKNRRDLTEPEINELIKYGYVDHVHDGWKSICKLCPTTSILDDRITALHEIARHILAVHGKKVLQN